MEFVSIRQAPAMQIKLAAFRPTTIPQGAYLGAPPMPPVDLDSVGVQRTLLAHRNTSAEVVESVTALLMEGRQELAHAIPEDRQEIRALLAQVKPPDTAIRLGLPIHLGAQQYYDKDKPAFVQQYADVVALLITIGLLFGSWGWEVRRWFVQRQKDRADTYIHQVVLLINRTQTTDDNAQTESIRRELVQLLTDVVQALDQEHISEESFQSFRVVWQIALDLLREGVMQPGDPDVPSRAA